jgi:hypothetical protein
MIYLQFSRQASFLSDVIAWFDHGHFSHVDCVMPDGTLLGARSDRYKDIKAGVQKRPRDYAKFALVVTLAVEASPDQESKFYEFLYAQIGKSYDHAAIWGFAFDRDWRQLDSWICSELIAAALEFAGIVHALYLSANKIAPVSLALTVSAIGAQHFMFLSPLLQTTVTDDRNLRPWRHNSGPLRRCTDGEQQPDCPCAP